jgi:hypothetical protein
MDRFLGSGARGLGAGQCLAFGGLLLELPVHPEQLDEHPHLGAQHLRHHRRGNVVDGTERVAALGLDLVDVGGDEDDRRLGRLAVLADQAGGLQPVDVGHVDIQQDHRELHLQDVAQRLLPGPGTDDVLVQLVEDGAEDDMLLGQVVHHQDIDSVLFARARQRCRTGFHWCSHARRTDSRSCVFTGLDR